jgi:hypothetical protein
VGDVYGFVLGALAVAWGVIVAFLDQPGASARRHADRLCTALLTMGAAVTVVGVLATVTGLW